MAVVAVTCVAFSRAAEARHPSGRRLYEVADRVIDTRGPVGDACVPVPALGTPIAPLSGLLNVVSRPSGGVVSDLASARFGHRARVSWLFITALLGGIFMLLFGVLPTLPVAIVLMVLYSFAYEQACGATYALVPFVSNRSPGLVSGFVSAGGTAGAALWNGFVFRDQTQAGYRNMG